MSMAWLTALTMRTFLVTTGQARITSDIGV
jgi:hypothetical protein